MSCYRVRPRRAPPEALGRNTIGGRPILARGQVWPRCHCDARMVFFFQLDLPPGLPLFGGHHLLVFQCAEHAASWLPPDIERLPTRFWEGDPNNGPASWSILVNRPAPELTLEPEPRLAAAALTVTPMTEAAPDGRGLPVFKLGGVPSWAGEVERYRCSCGAAMHFVGQIPEQYEFAAPDDDDRLPLTLFGGHEVYLHACGNRCDPRAVWPICQL